MFCVVEWLLEGLFGVISCTSIVRPRKELDEYKVGEKVDAKYMGMTYLVRIIQTGESKKDLNENLNKIIIDWKISHPSVVPQVVNSTIPQAHVVTKVEKNTEQPTVTTPKKRSANLRSQSTAASPAKRTCAPKVQTRTSPRKLKTSELKTLNTRDESQTDSAILIDAPVSTLLDRRTKQHNRDSGICGKKLTCLSWKTMIQVSDDEDSETDLPEGKQDLGIYLEQKRMKRMIENLENDVARQNSKYRKLKERVKKLEALLTERSTVIDISETPLQPDACDEHRKAVNISETPPQPDACDEHRKAVNLFCSSQYRHILKTLALRIFSIEDLALKSITGKRCALSGDNARKALDQEKLALLEKLFHEKCPDVNHRTFIEKLQNIQKVIRQKRF